MTRHVFRHTSDREGGGRIHLYAVLEATPDGLDRASESLLRDGWTDLGSEQLLITLTEQLKLGQPPNREIEP